MKKISLINTLKKTFKTKSSPDKKKITKTSNKQKKNKPNNKSKKVKLVGEASKTKKIIKDKKIKDKKIKAKNKTIKTKTLKVDKKNNSETNKKAETSLSAAAPTTTKRQGYITMPSGAGHDTQNMALLAPAGMIFVPSRDGISHAPEEFTEWQDIEKGANVLLHSIVKLLEENKEQYNMNTI